MLLTHGAEDAIVNPAVVEQHKAAIAHAQIHIMPSAGHAAFWDDAPTFNQHLRAFCESLQDSETGNLPMQLAAGLRRVG